MGNRKTPMPVIDNETIFKVLGVDGRSCHGGHGTWNLPRRPSAPGKWMPKIENVVPCARGYHLVKGEQVIPWLRGGLWIAEWKGEYVDHKDKFVVGQARLVRKVETWNMTTVRLWAADCAERVLDVFEKARPGDDRPRKAIEAARRLDATKEELRAAYAAVNAAANAADADAVYAANAAVNAANADAAAIYAANAAVNAAAAVNERSWQYARLTEYLNGTV